MRAGVHMCMCVRAYGCMYVCIGVCSSLYMCAYVHRYTCMSLITTQCDPSILAPFSVKKAVACEHNPVTLTCPAGQRVDIVKAFYGRTDGTTCPVGRLYSTNCSTDVKATVAARCVGQQCVLMADNTLSGNIDPCYGTYKYLTVEYRCIT